MFFIVIWVMSLIFILLSLWQWFKVEEKGDFYEVLKAGARTAPSPSPSDPTQKKFAQHSTNREMPERESPPEKASPQSEDPALATAPTQLEAMNPPAIDPQTLFYHPQHESLETVAWLLYAKQSKAWSVEKLFQSAQPLQAEKTVSRQLALNPPTLDQESTPQSRLMIANNIPSGEFDFDAEGNGALSIQSIVLYGHYQNGESGDQEGESEAIVRQKIKKSVEILNKTLDALIFDESFKPLILQDAPVAFSL